MNIPQVTIEELLEAGVHFGHNIRRWNPKMEQYIFGVRNSIHIIDLRITLPLINSALTKLFDVVSKSGKVLVVGTKKQCSNIVKEISLESSQYFVNKRWLGGTLTNWKTISKSIQKLNELEILLDDNSKNHNLGKKELLNLSREKEKLISNIGGIRSLGGKPDLVIVFDAIKDKLAILESNKLNIPVIAIVDSNADPDIIEFPIPGNDDALRAINLFAELFKQTMLNAKEISADLSKNKDEQIQTDQKVDQKNLKKKISKKSSKKNNDLK